MYCVMASAIWRVFERQLVCRALSRAWAKTGNRMAASIAMMAITTRSSISVNPLRRRDGRARMSFSFHRPAGRGYHEPGPHPLIQGALPRAGGLAEGAVPPDAEPHRMSWKPSNQPTHYDRRRVAAFSPVSEAVEKLDLPLIRSRKARVICN